MRSLESKGKLIKKRKVDSYCSLKECNYCIFLVSKKQYDEKSPAQRNKTLELGFIFYRTAAQFSSFSPLWSLHKFCMAPYMFSLS